MATILCVDDEAPVGVVLENALAGMGHDALLATSVDEAIKTVDREPCDLIISDYSMPQANGIDLLKRLGEGGHDIPVIIMTGYGSIETAVQSLRQGAIDYLTKPLRAETLRIAVNQALEIIRLRKENDSFRREISSLKGRRAIIGESPALRRVLDMVATVAPTRATVLLEGESGTGKELFARAIHEASPRSDSPFITLNCAAMPEGLVESALFGHEKGAFTGALARKRGRFERAHTGTVLLDEIGEMPLEAQVHLLRVIQHREVERVGGTERIPVDIRIIAATNQDLAAAVQSGTFREDLYFRLNVFPITVPPLRERSSDIPALVQHFIERKVRELKIADTPHLAAGAIENLMGYDWPGNVRELENVVERAMILHRGEPLRFDDLGTSLSPLAAQTSPETEAETLGLDTIVARHIRRVLDKTGGKIHGPGGAGELLGVNPNTLRYKMRKLGIPFRKQHRLS